MDCRNLLSCRQRASTMHRLNDLALILINGGLGWKIGKQNRFHKMAQRQNTSSLLMKHHSPGESPSSFKFNDPIDTRIN